MKNYKSILIISGVLILFYTLSLSIGYYLGAVQYPFLIFLIFGGIDSDFIRKEDVLLSFFSDYINDLFFGTSFIIFVLMKFFFLKYTSYFPNDSVSLFFGKSLVLLFFICLVDVLTSFKLNLSVIFIFYFINIIFMLFMILYKQKVKLQ